MSGVTAPEASTSRAAAAISSQQQELLLSQSAQQQQQQQQQLRKGTKQESFESRGKKGTSGSSALSRALIYNIPLPLYLSPHVDSNLSLLYSLSWTLSLSYQIILSQFKNKRHSRNRIPREAYLDEKIVGYWEAKTKSVWVLPTRQTQQHKDTQQARRRKSKRRDEAAFTVGSSNEAGSSTGSSATEEGTETQEDEKSETNEITPWMDLLWKRGFFGKGSLSRSEPTWWQREKNRVTGEHGKFSLQFHGFKRKMYSSPETYFR